MVRTLVPRQLLMLIYSDNQSNLDKLDEIEDHETLDNGLMDKHDEELEMGSGYHSDEDAILDDNKMTNQIISNKGKGAMKRHLTTQESISDTEFFQRYDGPGLKNLSKQDNIIEEEETVHPVAEMKPVPRTGREVHIKKLFNGNLFACYIKFGTTWQIL